MYRGGRALGFGFGGLAGFLLGFLLMISLCESWKSKVGYSRSRSGLRSSGCSLRASH